jgi:hypothetical protein
MKELEMRNLKQIPRGIYQPFLNQILSTSPLSNNMVVKQDVRLQNTQQFVGDVARALLKLQ